MLFWKHWGIFCILIYLKHVHVLYVLINTVKNTVIKWSEDSTVKKCQNKSLAQARSLLLRSCTGRWLPLRVNPRSLWRLPLSAPSALPVLLGPCHLGQPNPVLQSPHQIQPLTPLTLFFHPAPKLLAHKSQSHLPAVLSNCGSRWRLARHGGGKLAVDHAIILHEHQYTFYQQVSPTLHLLSAQVSRGYK